MLEKIFCNHEYVYIDKEYVINFPRDYYLFRFMCRKCRKKLSISSLKIDEIKYKYKSQLAEMVAVDGYVDNSNTEIIYPTRHGYLHCDIKMNGYVADKTNDFFRHRYHIDLKDTPLH